MPPWGMNHSEPNDAACLCSWEICQFSSGLGHKMHAQTQSFEHRTGPKNNSQVQEHNEG